MHVSSLHRQFISNPALLTKPLKPGQIVQGKITTIYPDNQAQIQLGNQRIIAQLQASLKLGGNYHFQVQSMDEILVLKVLGEYNNSQSKRSFPLLDQVGLKASKYAVLLMEQLIRDHIPFDKNQLKQAFELLSKRKDKGQAILTLKEMIRFQFPITSAVFKALHAKRTISLTRQMQGLLDFIQKQEEQHAPLLEKQLMQLLRPSANTNLVVQQFLSRALAKQPNVHVLLQHIGFTNNERLNRSNLISNLYGLIIDKGLNIDKAASILNNWEKQLILSKNNPSVFTKGEWQQFKQQVMESFPQLQNINSTGDIAEGRVLDTLRLLQKQDVYSELKDVLLLIQRPNHLPFPKEQFLSLLNQYLHVSGMDYEHGLVNNKLQEASIKGNLLSLLRNSEGIFHERIQQILHGINGIQVQSVMELESSFLQSHLIVPGSKLGFKNDIELNIEGRKTKQGKIDPDHCRILFVLDLMQMKETMIEMHIQNRHIAITVFNNHKKLHELSKSLQPLLKTGLQQMKYTLTSISFKPIENAEDNKQSLDRQVYHTQGVDYKV
ncbi:MULTISPECIES: hypothetical protein [Virgibacillus]|uniref:hypothetical protein n=1 Tax=Virgibacillus TaxID=84406 RepID=UPI000388539E|nr:MULTISPECIES: hypothetical protein [Virgibacillus]EQB36434.1 hypothetical protein M948_15495 [Virgibacillus sp. CM-4]MYL42267.1 hypothetical protein [Virgibacillus massiliensis]